MSTMRWSCFGLSSVDVSYYPILLPHPEYMPRVCLQSEPETSSFLAEPCKNFSLALSPDDTYSPAMVASVPDPGPVLSWHSAGSRKRYRTSVSVFLCSRPLAVTVRPGRGRYCLKVSTHLCIAQCAVVPTVCRGPLSQKAPKRSMRIPTLEGRVSPSVGCTACACASPLSRRIGSGRQPLWCQPCNAQTVHIQQGHHYLTWLLEHQNSALLGLPTPDTARAAHFQRNVGPGNAQ